MVSWAAAPWNMSFTMTPGLEMFNDKLPTYFGGIGTVLNIFDSFSVSYKMYG